MLMKEDLGGFANKLTPRKRIAPDVRGKWRRWADLGGKRATSGGCGGNLGRVPSGKMTAI